MGSNFNIHFLDDDSLGVGRASEWVGLEGGTKVDLVVLLVGPSLRSATILKMTRSAETTWLTHLQ